MEARGKTVMTEEEREEEGEHTDEIGRYYVDKNGLRWNQPFKITDIVSATRVMESVILDGLKEVELTPTFDHLTGIYGLTVEWPDPRHAKKGYYSFVPAPHKPAAKRLASELTAAFTKAGITCKMEENNRGWALGDREEPQWENPFQ
jgi:hypothetical protein